MNKYSDEIKKNPSNDRINVREMSNFQIKKYSNDHTQNLDRIMMERGSFFEQNSNKKTHVNEKGQVIFDNIDDSKFGEITGDVLNSSSIDRGLPMRSQYTKKRPQYDQNDHLDFNLFDTKPITKKVTNFDPSLIQGSGGLEFADISLSMTNMSTQLSPITLCSTQIDRLNNNLFYFLYDLYNQSYMTNGLGLFILFAMLFFCSNGITEIELKKVFDFPKKDELYEGLINIQNQLNNNQHLINFKNFMILGNEVPYDPKFYETIKEFCILIRVDISKPFSESKKINEVIKKLLDLNNSDMLVKNIVTADSLDKLQLMLLTTCVVHPIWEKPFDKIIEGKFLSYDRELQIKYLHSIANAYGYFEDNEHQVLEIKCIGGEMTMGFILHKNNINNDVDDVKLHYFVSHMKECILDEIKIPTFDRDYKIRFNNTLQNLGLSSVFTKISCPKFFPENVVLHDVVQNIKIIVDNKFIPENKNKQTKSKGYITDRKFICDKPFIYYFRMVKTNTILLIGLYQ